MHILELLNFLFFITWEIKNVNKFNIKVKKFSFHIFLNIINIQRVMNYIIKNKQYQYINKYDPFVNCYKFSLKIFFELS